MKATLFKAPDIVGELLQLEWIQGAAGHLLLLVAEGLSDNVIKGLNSLLNQELLMLRLGHLLLDHVELFSPVIQNGLQLETVLLEGDDRISYPIFLNGCL